MVAEALALREQASVIIQYCGEPFRFTPCPGRGHSIGNFVLASLVGPKASPAAPKGCIVGEEGGSMVAGENGDIIGSAKCAPTRAAPTVDPSTYN